MATFHVIGNTLVDPDELFFKHFSGEMTTIKALDFSTTTKNLDLSSGPIPLRDLGELQLRDNFQDIGVGKPLSVEIATVYTGKYKKFLGGRKDVVVVSGVKNAQTFQGTSRAINIKAENADENAFLPFKAFEDGTKIVYYSPAMEADSMVVSFEMMFDNFDTKLFDTISGLLNSAAGIPVFLPAAGYLLGGSQLINIGSKLGNTLFAGHPNLSGTISIQFQSPIIPPTEPREFVIYNDKDKDEFSNLKVALVDVGGNTELRLVEKADETSVYDGPAPYLIVLLDGAKRTSLENFAPTIASAAILKKFYGATDSLAEVTSVLQDAMQLYNDSTYKAKADKLKTQLDQLPKDSPEYVQLKTLYNAYAANIQSDNFKLVAIP